MKSLNRKQIITRGLAVAVAGMMGFVAQLSHADTPMPSAIDIDADITARTYIYQIQGKGHVSPLDGKKLAEVHGIVTGVRRTSFYMQDPNPDDDMVTSDGIFVDMGKTPGVKVGDLVKVAATVREDRPDGSDFIEYLGLTTLITPTVTIVSSNHALPAPVLLGNGGRAIPNKIIKDGVSGNVDTAGNFEPETDGLDFWESLEGMLVQINDPVVIAPTNGDRETSVVADNGANATARSARGALVVHPDDYNPERIMLNDYVLSTKIPLLNVGDRISGPVTGVVTYDSAIFKLVVLAPFKVISGSLPREVASAARADQFSIATLNCENLDANDEPEKFDRLAAIIANNLQAPDILSLEEIQDNSGSENDGTTSASQTLSRMIAAIKKAGGPTYDYAQIDPGDNDDGGQLGGNIRIVFLYREDRGLKFIERGRAIATTKVAITTTLAGLQLSHSPGRIDPTNAVFYSSRKPLAAEFEFGGRKLFVIANHFVAKIGDQPLFGRFQPPKFSSETKRIKQAQVVHNFIDQILALDANANVITLGDLNDNDFSPALIALKGITSTTPIYNTIERLPAAERYTYLFQGNAQGLDHILISNSLNRISVDIDIVHVNAEFADQTSDHDPALLRLSWATPQQFKVYLSAIFNGKD